MVFLKMIEREIDQAKKGKPAKIIIKVNAVVEERPFRPYTALTGRRGIKMIVRGICCLRPGVPASRKILRYAP